MLNNMQIIGNVTADAVDRTVNTARGEALVLSFSVAITEFFSGKEITTYFRVSAWNAMAERLMGKIHKGALVFVSGRIRVNTYTNNNNEEKFSLEISASSVNILRRAKGYGDEGQTTSNEWRRPSQEGQGQSYNRNNNSSELNQKKGDIVDLRSESIRSNTRSRNTEFKNEAMDFDSISNSKENYVAQSGTNRFNEDNKKMGLENPSIKKENIDFSDGDDEYE